MAVKKTNAMRILESQNIDYQVKEYEFDENHIDAVSVAEKSGIAKEQVFKTIVMRNESNEVFVFCVPSTTEVNPKKIRTLTKSKDIAPVKQTELLGLTGYIRGGCSPLGMKKKYKTYIDETAILFDWISVSAGQRGLQLLVNAEKLASAADAEFAELTL